jgi:hypothetical protein
MAARSSITPIAASLHFRHGLEACLFFALTPPEGVDATSKIFLSADVVGCKMEETKMSSSRPYYLIVVEGFHGRLIIIGKLMESLVTSYYRGVIIPACEFVLRTDATDAAAFHLVRAHAPIGQPPLHYVLRTKTAEARPALESALLSAMLLSDGARKPEPSKMRAFAVKAQQQTAVSFTAPSDGHTARFSVAASASGAAAPPLSMDDRLRRLEEACGYSGTESRSRRASERGDTLGSRLDIAALPPMPPRSEDFLYGGDADAKHRYSVYSELLETEKTHVRDLKLIVCKIMNEDLLAPIPLVGVPTDGSARPSIPSGSW